MKPNKPRMINSTKNYVVLNWDDCESIILREADKTGHCCDEEYDDDDNNNDNDKTKRWYILEKRDRILGWCKAYMGFKTQTKVGPLAPGDYYEFRLKITTGMKESEWSDVLFAVTKDDIVPAAQFHRVVENGPVTALRRILGQRPSAVDISNKFGQTPLRLAILKNNTNFMGILLNHGAEVESPDPGSKKTHLMVATQRGHIEAVQLLLEKGSSWQTKDRNGLTALNYAVDNSHIDLVRLAVENGVDVRAKDRFGWSSLMRGVILKSSLEVLTYLLKNGSDPNEADERKQTVLMQAVISGRAEVVKLLLNERANISEKNIYGHSAYDFAISSPFEEITKIAHLLTEESVQCSQNNKKFKIS